MSKLNMDDAIGTGFTFLDGDEMAATAKAPIYLIDGIIEQDAHGILYGASMSYKSFTVLEMAHCICTGRDFMGHKVKKQGAVVYICGEGKGAIGRRVKALVITHGKFGRFKPIQERVCIDSDDDMARLKSDIAKLKPALVIFDTFASLVSNTNEQDNGAVGSVLNLVRDTCANDSGTSSIIVHHTGKDESKGARGASAFKMNSDFEFELKRTNDFNTVMRCEKMKDGENFKDIHMSVIKVDLDIYDDDLKESTSLVLRQSDGAGASQTHDLDDEYIKVLNMLSTVIDDDGITPPKIVMDLFPDNPENAPKKVTTVGTWCKSSYDVMTADSPDEKKALEAKRSKFTRVRKKLYDRKIIGVQGDFVWIANEPKPA